MKRLSTILRNRLKQASVLSACILLALFSSSTIAQRPKPKKSESLQPTELSKLRDEYIKATKEYKTSLEKLVTLYEDNVKREEEKLSAAKKLFDEGLLSKSQLEETERLVGSERDKVNETRRLIANADTQIANIMVEAEADEQLARNLRLAKSRLVRTTSFTRFTGRGSWTLGEAWKIQQFFSDAFHKDLPIAVFGQGPIHDRWRLDHRNSMDVSLHPDGPEGQALLQFLQKNGIPFSAFRSAIPGTATGPHIHVGLPSHRY